MDTFSSTRAQMALLLRFHMVLAVAGIAMPIRGFIVKKTLNQKPSFFSFFLAQMNLVD